MAASHVDYDAILQPIVASLTADHAETATSLINPLLDPVLAPSSSISRAISKTPRKRKATSKAAASSTGTPSSTNKAKKRSVPKGNAAIDSACELLGVLPPLTPLAQPTGVNTTSEVASTPTGDLGDLDHDPEINDAVAIKPEGPAVAAFTPVNVITQPGEVVDLENNTVDKKPRTFSERIVWTYQLEEAAVNTLVDAIDARLRPAGTFKTEAWKRAMRAVAAVAPAEMQPLITRERVKQKLDSMKTLWRCHQELSDLSGWGVDKLGRFTAADDVMAAYFKAHPQAKVLSIKPMAFVDELTTIYGDTQASGSCARMPGQLSSRDLAEAEALVEDLLPTGDVPPPMSSRRRQTQTSSVGSIAESSTPSERDAVFLSGMKDVMSAEVAKVTASLSEASNAIWREKLPATQEAAKLLWSSNNKARYNLSWLVAASKSLENPYAAQIFLMAGEDGQDLLLRGYMIAGKVNETDLAQVPPLEPASTSTIEIIHRPHKTPHDGLKSSLATSRGRLSSPDWLDSPVSP